MKRILPVSFVSFLSGIYLFHFVSFGYFIFIAIALILAILLKKFVFRSIQKTMVLILLFFLLGYFYLGIYDYRQSKTIEPYIDQTITAYGKIIDIPRITQNATDFEFSVFGVEQGGDIKKTSFKIWVAVSQAELDYKPGDVLKLEMSPQWFDSAMNEGGFDSQSYFKAKGLWCRATVEEGQVVFLNNIHIKNVADYATNARLRVISLLEQYIQGEEAGFSEAILIGYKENMSKTLNDAFIKCGISHLVAVSGFNVGIVFLFVFVLLQLVTKNQKWISLAGIFAIIGFVFFTGISASVLRSAIMYILYLIATMLHRQKDTPSILAFTAFIILLSNPFFAFDVGFILTFSATIGIMWLGPILRKLLCFLPEPLNSLLSVSLSATIVSLPIMAYFFNEISAIAIICNIIFVPLVPAIMALSALTAIFGSIFPVLGIGYGFLADLLLKSSINLIYRLADLKFASVISVRPDVMLFIVYYLILYILVRLYQKSRDRRLIIYTGLCVVLICSMTAIHFWDLRDLSVNYINVGQGDSALVRFPGGGSMLIDGGGTIMNNDYVGYNIVLPFLRKEGINHLDYAVVSHYDQDHCEGVITLLKLGFIKTIITPPRDEENDNSNKIDQLTKEQHIKRIELCDGDLLKIKDSIQIQVLSPENMDNFSNSNENSLVFMIRYKNISFLFTGDIDSQTEDYVNEKYPLQCNVLKIPHHGSKNSYNEDFYKETKPQYAVISVGSDNGYGFPSDEVINALKELGTVIFRTDDNGNIEIRTDGESLEAKTFIES